MSKQPEPFENPLPLSELLHHLPVGKLEIITGVSDAGEVYHHPLPVLGHTLLVGGSNGKTNTALSWIVQLSAKNTPKQIRVAVIDHTAKHDLAKTLAPAPRQYVAHLASTEHEIEYTLNVLQKTLTVRLKQRGTPDVWLIVIEGVTELQSNPHAWAIVQSLLRQGKAAHMYVLATTRQFLLSGPLHDAFDTHITFAPASEDTSIDALSIKVADLHVVDAQPIVYLRIWFLSKLSGPCERCGEPEGKFLLERYVAEENVEDDETFTRQWYQAILEQMTNGLQVHLRQAICEACVSAVLDTFVQRKGTGHAMLTQSALFPKDRLSQISLVGIRQVGKPDVAVACVCTSTLEQLLEEILEKGIVDPEHCLHCGGPLGEPCGICQQPKCWACEGETAGILKICTACLNQYQTSVIAHLQDQDAAKKQWCDTCQDWMPDPHHHKSPRVWRS